MEKSKYTQNNNKIYKNQFFINKTIEIILRLSNLLINLGYIVVTLHLEPRTQAKTSESVHI